MNRRELIQAAMAAAAGMAAWHPLASRAANSGGRVIVVGGGMAGATVAKYLRMWSNGGLEVTLIERNPAYTSNIMSSLVLTGQRSMSSLRFGYEALKTRHGVKLVTDEVLEVDAVNGSVLLSSGGRLVADMRISAIPDSHFSVMVDSVSN
ncbi:FAD-dependent oxidoreductase [Roseateles albus]|uniref:FAD/NAD(P)-binding oxidoreductase n=1 Tax=Roseateles albus TaxID=2987525 RepID=A0ABT5KG84_9BURK|nr:FAD/NAD(P)-binding oxidoreductase [Roseateles albus]MDC8772870.1 FAD/NAD(P)-binding oxidoreductase [Roseateles albus]